MLLKKSISVYYFLNLIKWDVLAITCYSVIAVYFDRDSAVKHVVIPFAAATLVGTLLSLLLAFRTAQSYERWWEARIIWGAIVNDSRTLIRQLIQFLPEDDKKQSYITAFALRQSVWCFTLAENLRKVPFSDKVETYFREKNLESDNRPNALITKHAEDLAALSAHYNLDANKQVQLDNTLMRLTDSMGRCERIKNTVFPRSYSTLIHFFIYVMVTILPFGLEYNSFLTEIFISVVIPVLFIAIERTAILMQDPFDNNPTDTPMLALSVTIERNLMEMAGLPAPDTKVVQGSYYIM